MKGRILKIKTGYNPNSSSIGLDMVAFLTAGAGVTVLFNAIAAILAARKGGNMRSWTLRRSIRARQSGEAGMTMKHRFEWFGGVLALEDPPMLVHVDREFMRELGCEDSPLWEKQETSFLSAPLEVQLRV